LLNKKLLTVTLADFYVNVFKAWALQDLLSQIPKSMIVMDNASFPKRTDSQDSLTSAGHKSEY